jgi:hypothetical protein
VIYPENDAPGKKYRKAWWFSYRWEWASSKNEEKCRERTSAHQHINFDNICEIILASDGFSRHLEKIYKIFFTNLGNPYTGKCRNPRKTRLCFPCNPKLPITYSLCIQWVGRSEHHFAIMGLWSPMSRWRQNNMIFKLISRWPEGH